jgi:hypothetical protein
MQFSRTSSPSTPAWRLVPSAEAHILERWDPEFNLQTRITGAGWRPLGDLAAMVTEGQRADRSEGTEALYRPSNFDQGLLSPDADHLRAAPVRSVRAVGEGDVVVGKFLPLRAALITAAAPRHAPDGSCIRIVGLSAVQALWVAAVLGHEAFSRAASSVTGGASLPRVGARDLAGLPVPPVPQGVGALVAPWCDAADARLSAQREWVELEAEVQALADDLAPAPPDPQVPAWVPVADLPDSWAPDQAALSRYQHQLSSRGWPPLARFVVAEPARLREAIPPARLLKLNDAGRDLGFRLPDIAEVTPPWFRVYADPLRPGEVLLSTLGSSPKVVLNVPVAPSTVWVSDQWARLDGGAAPGALALALGISQVTWQLRSSATGAVRQFIGRDELLELRLPPLSSAQATSLHRRLSAALVRRADAEARLEALQIELHALVTAALEVSP